MAVEDITWHVKYFPLYSPYWLVCVEALRYIDQEFQTGKVFNLVFVSFKLLHCSSLLSFFITFLQVYCFFVLVNLSFCKVSAWFDLSGIQLKCVT